MIFFIFWAHEVLLSPTVNMAPPTVNWAPPTVNTAPPTAKAPLSTVKWAPPTVNVYSRRSRVAV